jgi:hypothetical protein
MVGTITASTFVVDDKNEKQQQRKRATAPAAEGEEVPVNNMVFVWWKRVFINCWLN